MCVCVGGGGGGGRGVPVSRRDYGSLYSVPSKGNDKH